MPNRYEERRFSPTIPDRPYPGLSRETIQSAISNILQEDEGFDLIAKLDGINILALAENVGDMDCYEFVFGSDPLTEIERLRVEGVRCGHESGATAFYFGRGHRTYNLRHVGIVTDRGTVISKWGREGHLFEHHPDFVPKYYGTKIGYFDDSQTFYPHREHILKACGGSPE